MIVNKIIGNGDGECFKDTYKPTNEQIKTAESNQWAFNLANPASECLLQLALHMIYNYFFFFLSLYISVYIVLLDMLKGEDFISLLI